MADEIHVTALVLLDLNSTFDTVDRDILLSMNRGFAVSGAVMAWFRSYPADRAQVFVVSLKSSDTIPVTCYVHNAARIGLRAQ